MLPLCRTTATIAIIFVDFPTDPLRPGSSQSFSQRNATGTTRSYEVDRQASGGLDRAAATAQLRVVERADPERNCGQTSIQAGVVVVDDSSHFCGCLSWLRVRHNGLGQRGYVRTVRPMFGDPQVRSCNTLGAMHESFLNSDDKNEIRGFAIDRHARLQGTVAHITLPLTRRVSPLPGIRKSNPISGCASRF